MKSDQGKIHEQKEDQTNTQRSIVAFELNVQSEIMTKRESKSEIDSSMNMKKGQLCKFLDISS